MDPATYYGHSEAEFGMSWCAGFTDAFYTGMQALHSFPGLNVRRTCHIRKYLDNSSEQNPFLP